MDPHVQRTGEGGSGIRSCASSARRWRRIGLGAAIVLVLGGAAWIVAPPATAASTEYSITDLGTLPGGRSSTAYDINTAGQIVGDSEFGSGSTRHAVLWRDGTITELGHRGGPSNSSVALAVNSEGTVIGYGRLPMTPYERAILWQNGFMSDISMDRAYGVNNQVQVSGGTNPSPSSRALLWERGATTDLGAYGGQAFDINNRRQLVGYYRPCCPYSTHAFVWENGTITDLGPGAADAINDAGQVVIGNILWDNGTVTGLGTLGGVSTHAYDINNGGQVVGSSTNASGSWHAFLWEGGVMQDLGTLPGGSQSWAYGVNDLGQVVGSSTNETGDLHAVLWTQVEPTHDVAVTSASADPAVALAGTPVTITATVENQGDLPETFEVNAFADSVLVGTVTVTNLAAGDSQTVSFTWDTTGFEPGIWSVTIEAVAVPGETDLADNQLAAGVVLILPGHLDPPLPPF